jgi:hypothetical protein
VKILIVFNREPYDHTDVTWNNPRLAGKHASIGGMGDGKRRGHHVLAAGGGRGWRRPVKGF